MNCKDCICLDGQDQFNWIILIVSQGPAGVLLKYYHWAVATVWDPDYHWAVATVWDPDY